MTYSELAAFFGTNPREIPTAPINGSTPKWFYAYEKDGAVYVSSGRTHANACRISPDRRLKESELQDMLELYHRRERGEPVAQEAKKRTVNQAYWYGIFRELSL